MRFDRLRAKGLGPFKQEIDLDLAGLPGLLVAVTGANGAGKTTCLELLAGALFRTTPTRGSLASLATERDAFVEVQAVNGAAYTIRQTVDAISSKGESLVLDASGRPVLPDTKISAFDKWAARHLPSPEVLFSSTFAAQGSGAFLGMKSGERKAVLLRVLGIERLERLADAAREKAREARSALQVATARLEDERQRAASVNDAEAKLDLARVQLAEAERLAADARATFDELEQKARNVESALAERRAAEAKRSQLRAQADQAGQRATELRARIDGTKEILARAPEIRAAAERAEQIKSRDVAIGSELKIIELRTATATREKADAEGRMRGFDREATSLKARLERARAASASEEAAKTCGQTAERLRGEVSAIETEAIELERLEAAKRLTLSEAMSDRILTLRDGLGEIASGHDAPDDLARTLLRDDDEAQARQQRAPTELEALAGQVRECRARLEATRRDLATTERELARLEQAKAVASELPELETNLRGLEDERRTCEESAASAGATLQEWAESRKPLERERLALAAERAEIIGLALRAGQLDAAEARLVELEQSLETNVADELASRAAEAALVLPDDPGPAPSLIGPRETLDAAERKVGQLGAVVAVEEARLADAKAAAARRAELELQVCSLEVDLADWTLLADSLGRDGLQALEIDAAGPELTTLVNDLLHTSFGARWTVTIEASRLSADGKKVLEGLDVRVLDSESGRDATVEALSGGERVIVGEAMSLALAMIACRRSGIEGPTLVRDESGAALDREKGLAYVAMLRRAAEIVGASRVLLVTHSPELAELCDARLDVADGRVTLDVAA